MIDDVGDSVYLYGFSSGSILALKAAASLRDRVLKLALLEPPLNEDDDQSKQAFRQQSDHIAQLLREGRNGAAVESFLRHVTARITRGFLPSLVEMIIQARIAELEAKKSR